MALKLYTHEGNPNAFKALIAAEFNGIKIQLPPFTWGVTNKSAEFLKLNPIGKVPVLATPEGGIFESNAIARYIAKLADKGLSGQSLYESGLIDSWVDFSSNELQQHLAKWIGPYYGYGTIDKAVEETSKANVERALATLNTHLTENTYIVGNKITLADITIVSALLYAIQGMLTESYMVEKYPHVQRHFFTVVNHPAVKKVVGPVTQIAVAPTDVVPEEKSIFPSIRARAEAAKKAAEKAAAPPAADEDDAEAPKPKAKNPLDSLPPSPMIMDNWKRLYSNTKAANFREVAIKGFWDMYDAEGYSLWFCDYKFNEENTVKFVTLNKVSGFLQRMDLVRKYGFAKMCILGADPGPYVIKGVWLFRGQEVPPFVLAECYDCELYEWTKVDLSDPVQKERVSQYFEEPDEIDGLVLQEAKCFK